MQDTRVSADPAAEAAVTHVHDAIAALRAALDQLEGALRAAAETRTDAPAPGPAAWAEPAAPEPERAAYDDTETGATQRSGWAASAEGDSAPDTQQTGAWGEWSASPSLRDGGWPSASTEAQSPPEHTEDDDVRDQVRRAVEQLKAELGESAAAEMDTETADYAAAPGVEATELAPVAEATFEAVSVESSVSEGPAVEPVAADDEGAAAEDAAATEAAPDGAEDIREKVRRAVMEARAELGSGPVEADFSAPAASPLEARIPHYEALLDKSFLSPACIVIEDPEGRVELVRVYRTLARLERAATANLANYSSHSVTIQMEERDLPSHQDIGEAVAYAFERSCKVDVDGNRANVLLTGSDTRAA
jgi:hypothetical protein